MEIKVKGLKEVEAQLIALGSKQGTKIFRASMLRASQPILDRARSNAGSIAKGSGALQASIGPRFTAGNKPVGELNLPNMGGRFAVQIAPQRGNKTATALYNLVYKRRRPVKGIRHGHLIEFGHRIVTRGKKEVRGSVPAQPFLLPALHGGANVAVSILARELEDRIARQLRKNARK